MDKITPIGNYILIEPIEIENTTKSGILLPSIVEKEHIQNGKIIGIGKQVKGDEIRIGDLVVFKKYAPDVIEVDEKELFVVTQEDILCIVK